MPLSREGKERSFRENLALARTLPGVAGMVNVIGYMQLGYFTSHVTGRVSGFGVQVAKEKFTEAGYMLGLVVSFIIGAMLASTLIEVAKAKHWPRYQLPLLIEALLLSVILLFETLAPVPVVQLAASDKFLFAVALSISMGLQNALVARLSGAVIRTSHLTGVSTDLGIELVRVIRWYFSREKDAEQRKDAQLYRVKLYLTILSTFLGGAVVGGLLNVTVGVLGMVLPVLIVVGLVVYDRVLGVSDEDVAENYNPRFDEKAVVANPSDAKS